MVTFAAAAHPKITDTTAFLCRDGFAGSPGAAARALDLRPPATSPPSRDAKQYEQSIKNFVITACGFIHGGADQLPWLVPLFYGAPHVRGG